MPLLVSPFARHLAGRTQKEWAALAGVPQQRVSAVLGGIMPTLPVFTRLAAAAQLTDAEVVALLRDYAAAAAPTHPSARA